MEHNVANLMRSFRHIRSFFYFSSNRIMDHILHFFLWLIFSIPFMLFMITEIIFEFIALIVNWICFIMIKTILLIPVGYAIAFVVNIVISTVNGIIGCIENIFSMPVFNHRNRCLIFSDMSNY